MASDEVALVTIEEQQPWLRLDKRMLLVHPLNEIVRLLPVLLISLVLGTQSGNHVWGLVAVGVLVLIGLSRWFTTTYRIGPVHVQLRRGLLQRKLLSIPRDRIRSVDVEANLFHRLLGLSVLRVGTGQQSETKHASNKFELNALSSALVPSLRADLLSHRVDGVRGSQSGAHPMPQPSVTTGSPPEIEMGHWSPSWVRYAPFSLTGILTLLAAVGFAFQFIGEAADTITHSSAVRNGLDLARTFGPILFGLLVALLVVVLSSVLASVRYLLSYGGFRLTDNGQVLHLQHGLIKNRQTTLNLDRLRGTSLREPLLLRMVNGAKLDAIMTGVSAGRAESSLLLPQGPRAEIERVMATVLRGTEQASATLQRHGVAALRRRITRALWPTWISIAALVIWERFADYPHQLWILVPVLAIGSLGLAVDRYCSLGHAVLPGWLITRSGSLDRSRDSLESNGIIGWTVRNSFFQRRVGVADVIAATPAGTGKYLVIDLPESQAWPLIEAVTPGMRSVWAQEGTGMSELAPATMREPALRPSPKARLLWSLTAVITAVIAFVPQAIWAIVDRWTSTPHVLVALATVTVAAAYIMIVPAWRYRVHRWEISEDAVYTRTGWFVQERRIAPISRVQTVDTERGPLERLLGLATVTVTTASSAGAVKIEALDVRVADQTVAELTEIAKRNRDDAT